MYLRIFMFLVLSFCMHIPTALSQSLSVAMAIEADSIERSVQHYLDVLKKNYDNTFPDGINLVPRAAKSHEIIRELQLGRFDAGIVNTAFLSHYFTDMSRLNAPYARMSADEYTTLLHKIVRNVPNYSSIQGLRIIFVLPVELRNIAGPDEISDFSDLRGKPVIAFGGWARSLKRAGFEVENNFGNNSAGDRFFEIGAVSNSRMRINNNISVSLTEHRLSSRALVVSEKYFESLPDHSRNALANAAQPFMIDMISNWRSQEEDFLASLLSNSVKVNVLDRKKKQDSLDEFSQGPTQCAAGYKACTIDGVCDCVDENTENCDSC